MKSLTFSLKHNLLLWVSVPIIIAGIFITLMAFIFSWHEIEEVYDANLVHSALVLYQMSEHQLLRDDQTNIVIETKMPVSHDKYEKKIAFRLWHDGVLLTQSENAERLEEIIPPEGFSNQTMNGNSWRFYVFIDSGTKVRVETFEQYTIRYEMVGELMVSLVAPAGLLIVIILIVIWVGVNKSLKQLTDLSVAVDARHSDDLTPIELTNIPKEIFPLFIAFNNLFLRIADSFRREREFTDHAAHELRTPLAAMKTQTQVLIKKTADYPECAEGFRNLNATIDRGTHLIEQLLSFARLQNETLPLSRIDFSELLNMAVSEFFTEACLKGKILKTDIAKSVIIYGHAGSLSILLRNFFDNAVKYTQDNGVIDIYLSEEGVLEIRDNGPGISEEDKLRVFDRFVRVDKAGHTGSGLGLSIAQWIARAHNTRIYLLNNEPCGLIVRILFV